MTPAGVVSIEMKAQNSNTWDVLVDQYASSLVYPDQLRIGFTASTGGVSSVQELRNFVVTPVDPPECWDDSASITVTSVLSVASVGARMSKPTTACAVLGSPWKFSKST